MGTIWVWISFGVSVLSALFAGFLYIDGRCQRKALSMAKGAIDALQAKVAKQDEQIGSLTRALALLVPADARPTAPHHPVGLSHPFVPSLAQVAAARSAHAETRGKTLPPPPPKPPPLDTEGDRGGIIPGDPIPTESPEDIRARFEAEADARSQARGGLPSMATDDEPEDERTRVYSGRARRGLAGAPLERPGSDPSRAAREYVPRRASPSSPTLVSPGAVPPSEPGDGSVTVEAQHEDGRPLSEREGPKSDER
jgi:hypothetical protein